MSATPEEATVRAFLAEVDAAFAAGDADRFAAAFDADGRLLLLHNPEPISGRASVLEFWRSFFAEDDTSDWESQVEFLETRGDRAFVLMTYTERLRSRDDGRRTLVRGRLAYWLRRDEEGAWRIAVGMNSHSHPAEPIP